MPEQAPWGAVPACSVQRVDRPRLLVPPSKSGLRHPFWGCATRNDLRGPRERALPVCRWPRLVGGKVGWRNASRTRLGTQAPPCRVRRCRCGRDPWTSRLSTSRPVPNRTGEGRGGTGQGQTEARGLPGYPTTSSFSPRAMRRPIASSGSTPSKSTACTACVMGMSTLNFAARSMTLRVVQTPSTTWRERLR